MSSLSRFRPRDTNIWPGFVDGLSALLIVVIFILMIFIVAQFYLTQLLSGRDEAVLRLERQLAEQGQLLASERDANEDLRLNVAQLSAELANANGQRDDLTARLDRLQQQRDALQTRLTATTAERAEFETRIAAQAQERTGLEERLGQVLSERDALLSRLSAVEEAARLVKADRDEVSAGLQEAQALIQADRNTIALQLADLERLRRDLAALEKVRAEMEVRVAELLSTRLLLQEEIAAVTARADRLGGEAEGLRASLETLRERHGALEQTRSDLLEQLASLTAQRDALTARRDEIAAARDRALAALTARETEIGQLQQARETDRAARDKLLKDIAALSRERDVLRAARADLAAERDRLQAEGATISSEFAATRSRLAEVLTALEAARAETAQLTQREAALTTDATVAARSLAELMTQYGQERDRSKELEAKLAALQDRTLLAQKEIGNRDLSLRELTGERDGLRAGLDAAQARSAADRDTITRQAADLERLRRDLAALETVRAEMEVRVAELLSTRLLLQKEIAAAAQRADRLDGEAGALRASLETLRERQGALERERSDLLKQLASLTAQRDALTERRDEMVAARDRALANLTAREAEITQLQRAREADRAARDRLLEDIGALSRERDALLAARDALTRERDQAATGAATVETDAAATRARLAEVLAALEAARSRTAELTKSEAALRAEAAGDAQRIADLMAQYGQARDRSKELEAKLAAVQGSTLLAQKEIGNRDLRLRELEEQLDLSLDSLEAEKQAKAAAEATAGELNQRIAALRREVAGLQATLKQKEQEAEAMGLKIQDLSGRLNRGLVTRVQELARFRSEFFGRLRDVLEDRRDIRVVGDRFLFQAEVLFKPGSADIGFRARRTLNGLADTLRKLMPRIPKDINWILQIDGHTDQVPIANEEFPSNWHLSAARAISVVRFLIREGIPAARLSAAGYGEFQPIDDRNDSIGNRRNRRIELKLTQR